MADVYTTIKAGAHLDNVINLKDARNQLNALEWKVEDIRTNFLDRVAQDDELDESIRAVAKKLSLQLEKASKNKRKEATILALGVDPAMKLQDLPNHIPQDVRVRFPLPRLLAKPAPSAVPPPANRVPPVVPRQPKELKFKGGGVFDLLGYIISCLGPLNVDVRSTTTITTLKERFFTPLIVLYGKWCATIVAECGASRQLPSMVEIAVRATSRDTLYYALGASVAGFEGNPNFQKSVRKDRKEMLVNSRILTQQLLEMPPPQRVLSLLAVGNRSVKIPSPNGQEYFVLSPKLLTAWTNSKKASPDRPWVPVGEDIKYAPQITEMRKWTDQIAKAKQAGTAVPALEFQGDVLEMKKFADDWLNPDLVKQDEFGQDYGTCGETYPLIMMKLLDEWQENISNATSNVLYGGLAMQPSQTLMEFQPMEYYVGINGNPPAITKNPFVSPCSNCRALLKSQVMRENVDVDLFMVPGAKPFGVQLDVFAKTFPM